MKFLVLIAGLIFLVGVSGAEVEIPYIPPNKVNVVVHVNVDFDPDTQEYIYSYEVENLPDAEQKVVLFSIYPQGEVHDIRQPEGWAILIREEGRIVWDVSSEISDQQWENALIAPGEKLCCFSFRSKFPPVEGKFDAMGDTPIPRADDAEEIEAQIERDFGEGHNVFADIFMGDTLVPGPFLETRIRVVPRVINVNFTSRSKMEVHIEPPQGYRVEDIDPNSIIFQGTKPVKVITRNPKFLIAIFDRHDVKGWMVSERLRVYLWGKLKDGTPFRGSDVVSVIDVPEKRTKPEPEKPPVFIGAPVKPAR